MKNETVKPSSSGIGNLSTKNRLRHRFSRSKWTEIFRDEFQTGKQNRFLRRETGL
jgi:hypothetical protein